jgi:hypothetical protein
MTAHTLEKRWQHLQATSLMLDFDKVNFPVTVAKCIYPFGSRLNSIWVIEQQNDNSEVRCNYPKAAIQCKSY